MKGFNRWIKSKQGLTTIIGVFIVVLVVVSIGQVVGWWDIGGAVTGTAGIPAADYPQPVGGYTCLPTCDEKDGKFFILPGEGTRSFTAWPLVVWIAVPGNTATFDLGIFDGDSGKDNNGNINWTAGNWENGTDELVYTLYADPLSDGAGATVLNTWHGNQDNMPNNAWFSATIPNAPTAKAPSGHYFYRLEVTRPASGPGSNVFKLRASGYLKAGNNVHLDAAFGISGAMSNMKDFQILYPQNQGLANTGPSLYSGDWLLYFEIPNSQKEITIWDGDFDRGTNTSVGLKDTDDPNTPDTVPDWASGSTAVVAEREGGAGIPSDNSANPFYQRGGPVYYEVVTTAGAYANSDPSGTEEWEKFTLEVPANGASVDPTIADMAASSLPAGQYVIHVVGLDISNHVWLRTNFFICDPEDGCGPCVFPGCDQIACPRTIGYWKNNVKKVLIDKKPKGVQETAQSLDWALKNVALASSIFRTGINFSAPIAIPNPVRLTDQEAYQMLMRGASQVPYPADKNSMLARALQQNLAAWLNLASGKINDNTVITLNLPGGAFEGTVWQALQEAQTIILNNDTANMERAKDIGDQINNGLLGEDVSVGSCDAGTDDSKDYNSTMPKDKQPPKHKDMPKAPKPELPGQSTPGPAPVCTASNIYNVENPTNNPFYGIKFEFQSGAEVRDGGYDILKVTLPASVVQGMTSVQLEAKSSTNVSIVTIQADFTSPVGGGEPIVSESGLHGFAFMGAVDNGDGTYTLSFQVVVYDNHGLSHATIGLPDGVVPSQSGSFTSEACTAP